MAEKKGVGHAYNVDFLNVVFAASSIFLFLSVIWMVWDDYDRDWKSTQRQFVELEYQVTQANLDQAGRDVDQNKLTELQSSLAAAQKNVEANQAKIDELNGQMAELDARLARESQDYQFAKATYDQDRYDFEAARAAGASDAERKGEAVKVLQQRTNDLQLQLEKTTAERNALQRQLDDILGESGKIQGQITEIQQEQGRLRTRLRVLEPSVLKPYFRDAPLLDFMAPTLKVQQVILPNIVDDVNFVKVAKMDRCQTCHLAIDRAGYEKYPQPFRTHPNLGVYLGSNSKHPLDQVGCTVCHEGMGQSVSFRDASHAPSTPEQAHEWEEKYDWEEPHLWDYPMLPLNMTEASCAKCHKQEVFIPNAEKLSVAYATYERAGCYACHKTRGFENLRKPGPTLTKIGSKLSEDWVKTWIRNPKAVKPTTWMPRVWYNSNSSSPEDAVRNEVEINATVAYLFANDEEFRPETSNPPRGDAKRGRADRQVDRLPGVPRRRRKDPRRGRAASDIRSAAAEHRQQDHLRVDLRLGARSEALQPRHVHARPAPHRCAGGRRRHVPDDAEAGGRRRRQGNARPGRGRSATARLLPFRDAVRAGPGGSREARRECQAARARAARHCPVRLLQLPRDQGLRDDTANRHRAVGSRQQARLPARFRVRARHPAQLEDRVVPDEAARSAGFRRGTRPAAPTKSCGCRISSSPTTRSSAC